LPQKDTYKRMNAATEPLLPDFAPSGTPPHVAVAPRLLDHEHTVARNDDDTDEDYQARTSMFAAVLHFVGKG